MIRWLRGRFRRKPEGLVARERLLRLLESGVLDGMECPDCRRGAVSVWFTRPAEGEYRTWFVCGACSFRCRVQETGRPAQFVEGRVDKALQAYDADLWSRVQGRESVDERDRSG